MTSCISQPLQGERPKTLKYHPNFRPAFGNAENSENKVSSLPCLVTLDLPEQGRQRCHIAPLNGYPDFLVDW
ncbi:hypothetical protein MST27_20415, partial [Pseudomonas sp. PS1]|nr:hypothetical protein [Pseudomonas marianensis]